MSTKKTFENFVNSMNENVDLYKVYKKVSGKYSLRKPSYWGDLFNQRASIPYRELRKFDKELNSLDVYTTKELGCHNEYPLQSNFKVQVPQVFVLYCNTEGGELGEFYGMSILVNTEGATYPRYACGMPDFEPELHNFANGIPESYLNIVTTGAQLLHEQMIVEGQFSWLTSDTNTQIGSEKQNMITVFMYDNMGNKWTEKDYEGYGEFGGMDYYDLVATMNGYTEEDVKTMKGSFKALRQLGIDLAFGKIKTKDKKKKTLFPALVEDPRFNWKRHDFTQEAESDPNQSWFQEEESDDDYDDDYENGWYESKVTEATVVMDAIDPKSKTLKKLLKKYNVKMKVLTMNGPGGGHPEVEMTGSREDLQSVLADPNGWDDPELGEYIEESNILEARSINKISKEFGETVNKMKDIVKIYIAAEDGSDEKATTRQQLIDLTQKKKALVKELDDAVAGKNKDVKLVISEGVMSDIHQMIGNHKSFDTFQKEFFKEYGHKKVMKKTPEFLEWLKALYNDFEYAVEEKYTKKSLLKKLGDADDAMIQTGNGKEYIIYNPDSNNDDNAAMWHDKSVFALDQDGGEHEIAYKDIGLVMVESAVNEANGQTVKEFGDLLALLLDEDSGLDIERAIIEMDPKKARVLQKQISTLYKKLFDLTNDGFNLREDNSIVNESVSRSTKIYQIATPAPQSQLVLDLEELFSVYTGTDYRSIVIEFKEDEGYESVLMFNLSKSDIKKIEDNIADVLIWEYSIKKGKTITESVVAEDIETIGNLNHMAHTDLERIADYADMIKDRMSKGQDLDAWMYHKISDSVSNLNSVHDTMDGTDGVVESKIQIKRRYTDNHPAQTSGRIAKVRNAMIEALADGVLTEEEFNNILKEKSIDNKRWMRRNSKYFTVSENGISLSKFGKRILTGIKPVVSLTLESFISENTESVVTEKEGVKHYTEDGKEWTGPTHKMPDGTLMTQNPHNEDSEKLFHKEDLKESTINEWGSSDQNIFNKSMHKEMGSPRKMPSPFDDKLRDVAADNVDHYWDDWDEYDTDRDGLIDNAVRGYLRSFFKKDFEMMQKMFASNNITEANYIKFKGKKVDISSLEMEDVDMKDYPDFSDAYFSYGEYSNGKEMTDEELSNFTDDNLDLANELAHDSLH
jgi:hypothetical protein